MKTSYAAILALALPASLVAQQPSGSPPANPVTAAFRGRILTLHRNIGQAFDSIPETKFGYKPTPAQLTIGYIAQHLVNDNYLFCNNFGAMKGTRSAKDTTTADSVKAQWPKDTLVTKLKASFAFCESAIAQLDDAKLADQVTMTFGGQSRTVTRAGMALGHALDMADHYSQLANYMRLNNILPPTALPRPRPGGLVGHVSGHDSGGCHSERRAEGPRVPAVGGRPRRCAPPLGMTRNRPLIQRTATRSA